MNEIENLGNPVIKSYLRKSYYISREVEYNRHQYMRADGKWFWCMSTSVEGQLDGGTYFSTFEEASLALHKAMAPAPTSSILTPSLSTTLASETIVAAAVQIGGLTLSLPRPAGHGEVLAVASEAVDYEAGKMPEVQGFMTSEGRFVTRVEAMKIAHRAGQEFRDKERGQAGDGQRPRSHQLFSEDLW